MIFTTTAFLVSSAISIGLTAISSYYQHSQAQKAREKAQKEAEDRKGLKVPVEGEIIAPSLIYGRARIAGARVYHKVKNSYIFADAHISGVQFLSRGDARLRNVIKSSVIPVSMLSTDSANDPPDWTDYSITGLTNISWDSPTEHTTNVNAGQDAYIKVGTKIVAKHPPFYDEEYWKPDPDNDELLETNPEWRYTVVSYNGTTLVLKGEVGQDGPNFQDATVEALHEDESGRGKNDFLYVNQVLCIGGIREIYTCDIDEKDFRYAGLKDTRIHAYPNGNIVDPMIFENDSEQATAKFHDVAHSSQVFTYEDSANFT
jgi:hypothetical protein